MVKRNSQQNELIFLHCVFEQTFKKITLSAEKQIILHIIKVPPSKDETGLLALNSPTKINILADQAR
jgi:hypothetical protein